MTRRFGILCFLTMLFFAGCSPERNLARQYVKNHIGNGIMVIPLNELLKDNRTLSYDTSTRYNPEQLDSMAWVQSEFVKHISDSIFLTLFTNRLIQELGNEGFDVYVDGGSDVFLSLPDPKWLIQVAQLQVDEQHMYNYYQMYDAETGEPYYDSIRINQVSLSSWFEVSRANTGNKQVLFLEGYIQDQIKRGINFNLMEGSVGMEANRSAIRMIDIYNMANALGKKHAELLFDYFINDYIRDHLPAGIVNRKYFYYDHKSKTLKHGLTERFDVVN